MDKHSYENIFRRKRWGTKLCGSLFERGNSKKVDPFKRKKSVLILNKF